MAEKIKTTEEIIKEAELERQRNYNSSIAERIKWQILEDKKKAKQEKVRAEKLKEEKDTTNDAHTQY